MPADDVERCACGGEFVRTPDLYAGHVRGVEHVRWRRERDGEGPLTPAELSPVLERAEELRREPR